MLCALENLCALEWLPLRFAPRRIGCAISSRGLWEFPCPYFDRLPKLGLSNCQGLCIRKEIERADHAGAKTGLATRQHGAPGNTRLLPWWSVPPLQKKNNLAACRIARSKRRGLATTIQRWNFLARQRFPTLGGEFAPTISRLVTKMIGQDICPKQILELFQLLQCIVKIIPAGAAGQSEFPGTVRHADRIADRRGPQAQRETGAQAENAER
jgi:hypothetical protein